MNFKNQTEFLIFIVASTLILRGISCTRTETLDIDCYYEEFTGLNETGSQVCKDGYIALSDMFDDEEDYDDGSGNVSKDKDPDLSSKISKESFVESRVYCCPLEQRSTIERIGWKKIVLWPNEVKGTLTRAIMRCHASDIPGLDTIRFLLYEQYSTGLFDYKEMFTDDLKSVSDSGFVAHAPVKIIIHGFMSSAFVGPAPALRGAYATIPETINIIIVHWEALANLVTASDGICYEIAAESTKYVGRKTAKLIEFLVQNDFTSLDKIHVLGHSLGAHAAGFVGKYLTIGKLPRISAFDPARPSFDGKPPSERVDFTDAEFVDVIHTATKQWKLLGTLTGGLLPFPVGIRTPLGHKDFYPNKGTHQPGCYFQIIKLPVLCSHSRSYWYYADSIRYRKSRAFLAEECRNLERLEDGECGDKKGVKVTSRSVIMGEFTKESNATRNVYFVKTNSRSPFPKDLI